MQLLVTIEIPKNSNVKYEYDRHTKKIIVDRILHGATIYPQNYGFLEEALDWDGDELDVLVIADQAFQPGIQVPTRIIGAMEMVDNGETDTKLIGVIDCDPRYNHIKKFSDIPEHLLLEIKDFFEIYKNLQKKKVVVKGFKDEVWAKNEYEECVELMRKYGHLKNTEFVELMKKEHPEKYTE